MKGFDFRPRSQGLRAQHLLALTALAALVASGAMVLRAEEEAELLQQALTVLPKVRPTATSSTAAQVQADAALSLPWAALFGDLDAALDEHSVLLELEPDTESGHLRIVAEASDLAAMLAFLERLQHSASLHAVQLSSHRLQDTGQSVRFVVRARWRDGPASSLRSDTSLRKPAG